MKIEKKIDKEETQKDWKSFYLGFYERFRCDGKNHLFEKGDDWEYVNSINSILQGRFVGEATRNIL